MKIALSFALLFILFGSTIVYAQTSTITNTLNCSLPLNWTEISNQEGALIWKYHVDDSFQNMNFDNPINSYSSRTDRFLPPPVLFLPANHTTNVSTPTVHFEFEFDYTIPPPRGSYFFEIYASTSSSFPEPPIYSGYLEPYPSNPVRYYCDYVIAPVLVPTPYFWKVRASFGGQSAISDTWDFIYVNGAIPDAAILVSPADGSMVQGAGATLQWSAAETGGTPDWYMVYFEDRDPPLDEVATQTTTTYEVGNLDLEVCYYWQIIPHNGSGDAANCPIWSFKCYQPQPTIEPGIPEHILHPAISGIPDVTFSIPSNTAFDIDYEVIPYSSLSPVPPNPSLNNSNSYAVLLTHDTGFVDLTVETPNGLWWVAGYWGGTWHLASPYPANYGITVLSNIDFQNGRGIVPIVLSEGPGNDITLPVELSSFTAVASSSQLLVSLQWSTESETNNLGFNILRSGDSNLESAIELNLGIITGTNTSNHQVYHFADETVESSHTYYYWLEDIDLSGFSRFNGPILVTVPELGDPGTPPITEPNITRLNNAFPNPFNPQTMISFDLKDQDFVTIQVFNVNGQLIKTLIKENLQPNHYQVPWYGTDDNGKTVGSGVYFYRMIAGKHSFTRKVALIK